jgi:uncharacterized membrane protein YeaQ/YmgE (transglycosylase-associated protein family)
MDFDERGSKWPVDWSAVWVGALTALAVALVFGLAGIALGAHKVGVRVTSWSDFSFGALIFSVLGAFLAFAAGGWSACKLGGFRQSERAILHGGIVWTVATPILLIVTALGAGVYLGGWYGGLAGTPAWVVGAKEIDPNAALMARNSALGSLTALLLGLVGAAIGGWMGSGQPMRISFRKLTDDERAARAKVRSV